MFSTALGTTMNIRAGTTVVIAESYAATALALAAVIEQWGGTCRTVHSKPELDAAL